MTNYLQDLVSADLSKLWWSAPTFFYDITRALVDFTIDHDGGMSSWGARDRQAFRVAFDAEWTPDHAPVEPKVTISPMKVRFSAIPALVATADAAVDKPIVSPDTKKIICDQLTTVHQVNWDRLKDSDLLDEYKALIHELQRALGCNPLDPAP
jgi:hypothetical protein